MSRVKKTVSFALDPFYINVIETVAEEMKISKSNAVQMIMSRSPEIALFYGSDKEDDRL